MDQHLFSELYQRARDIRRFAHANKDLGPWFRGLPTDPVLGFGLPATRQRVAIVTIGLNPSPEEFARSLPLAEEEPRLALRVGPMTKQLLRRVGDAGIPLGPPETHSLADSIDPLAFAKSLLGPL